MKANLYDFDRTAFPIDSGFAFWRYCLRRKISLIRYLPRQMAGLFEYVYGSPENRSRDKAKIYSFLQAIDGEQYVKDFWDKNRGRICEFFRPENREYPAVVCSASPDFLLRPICDELHVDTLLATIVDIKTGVLDGDTCKRQEKVRRIKETVPDYEFVNVYSDSLKNDLPILLLGERAFYTRRGVVKEISVK